MAVTLEQAKLNVQDDLQTGVIDEFAKSNFILRNLTFDDCVSPTGGGSTLTYGYTRLKTQPTAAFRAINSEYTPQEVEKERITVDLKVFGGSFQIDRVINSLGGIISETGLQMAQEIKKDLNDVENNLVSELTALRETTENKSYNKVERNELTDSYFAWGIADKANKIKVPVEVNDFVYVSTVPGNNTPPLWIDAIKFDNSNGAFPMSNLLSMRISPIKPDGTVDTDMNYHEFITIAGQVYFIITDREGNTIEQHLIIDQDGNVVDDNPFVLPVYYNRRWHYDRTYTTGSIGWASFITAIGYNQVDLADIIPPPPEDGGVYTLKSISGVIDWVEDV